MRRMLMALILGAALTLPAESALACGDHVDCRRLPGPPPLQDAAPAVHMAGVSSTVLSPTQQGIQQMRGENREH